MSVRRTGTGLVVLLVAAALAGCGSSSTEAGQTPGGTSGPSTAARTPSAPASSAPASSTPGRPDSADPATTEGGGVGATTLRSLAIRNGPGEFPLPADLIIDYQVDNPNNVTLVIDVSQGGETYRFLRSRLAAAGYVISADRQQSLVFTGKGWEGAFTVSDSLAALTLRRP